MDYEQRYKQALERAKKLQETCDSTTVVGWCEYIFPELKESEDVRIKKTLIAFFRDWERTKSHCWNVNVSAILAWLEKQGEQKPYGQRKECEDCQFNYAGECKGSCALKRNEHKPTDKVEPKFKVGDWVVYDHRPYQVVELPKEGYINLGLRRNGKVEFAPSPYCRHWTIADAKDGDVLYSIDSKQPFIYKERPQFSQARGYCCINKFGEFAVWNTIKCVICTDKYIPATKEQRDLLFQKMADAGYEWDNDKKELKKIVPKKLDPDRVIKWLNDQACQGWIEDVEVDKFVDKFKKDFGL